MTTIAYRNGWMAADSMLTQGDENNTIYVGDVDKIIRLDDGSLLGLSGDAEGQHVVNVLNDKRIGRKHIAASLAEIDSEVNALLVRPDGTMWWVATNGEGYAEYYQFRDRFAAIGTGKELAYGAMEVRDDVTALEAVQAAARRHAFTAGPFTAVELNPPKRGSGSRARNRT